MTITMTPRLRKCALTAHVIFSVGWIGAVAGFLSLAVAGLTSQDVQKVRAAYLAMELISWLVIVPLSFAAPLTGLVQALGTPWGLFRHWWVLMKFLITVPCTLILLMHMEPIIRMSDAAKEAALFSTELGRLQFQLAADSALALLVLIVIATLAIHKPRGMTRYGARKLHQQRTLAQAAPPRRHPDANDDTGVSLDRGSTTGVPRWVMVLGSTLLVLALVVRTFTIGGMSGH